ncbi:hypothetical protein QBC44DRAFT_358378 [Cladorrhinum sp. PSN332]|nr:hypothetical protein QBC44DRAFT_358378 [Cladorrhinum sp. PSN332]
MSAQETLPTADHAIEKIKIHPVALNHMDPFSIAAGSLGVADVISRLLGKLRNLHQGYRGALENVGHIAAKTDAIETAVQEISSLLQGSPDVFPDSFFSKLTNLVMKASDVISHIQDHVESVQTEAESSSTKGKLLHLRRAEQVAQWDEALHAHMGVLSLLLSVAQMRSNAEKTATLKQESSRKLFEKASSMSAKICNSDVQTHSSPQCSSSDALKTFLFDTVLLETTVYQRACQSYYKKGITKHGQGVDSRLSPQCSLSSNEVLVDRSEDEEQETAFTALCPQAKEPGKLTTHMTTVSEESTESQDASASHRQLFPGTSRSTGATTQSVADEANTKTSDLATTISANSRSATLETKSAVLVTVEGACVGREEAELPPRGPGYFETINSTISNLRDRVLASKGIEQVTSGCVRISTVIEAYGDASDRFRLTKAFLRAALEQLDEGIYSSINIIAKFRVPLASESNGIPLAIRTARTGDHQHPTIAVHSTMNLVHSSAAAHQIPHFSLTVQDTLPWTALDEVSLRKGGYSEVFKVMVDSSCLFWGSGMRQRQGMHFAVKKLTSSKTTEGNFLNEIKILNRISSQKHAHLIQLLASYTHSVGTTVNRYLLFPWADCNLRELWQTESHGIRKERSPALPVACDRKTMLWALEQCRGLAKGLQTIHSVLNATHTDAVSSQERRNRHLMGRHGDIKPENILWFSQKHKPDSLGTLVISDFGISKFHQRHESRAKYAWRKANSCTLTYRAPEYDTVGWEVGRSFDLWSFGCVLLEFATWLMEGYDGLEIFRKWRHRYDGDGAYFVTDSETRSRLNPAVHRQFLTLLQTLWAEVKELDSPLYKGLSAFILVASTCFDLDHDRRPSAGVLANRLGELYAATSMMIGSSENTKQPQRRGDHEVKLLEWPIIGQAAAVGDNSLWPHFWRSALLPLEVASARTRAPAAMGGSNSPTRCMRWLVRGWTRQEMRCHARQTDETAVPSQQMATSDLQSPMRAKMVEGNLAIEEAAKLDLHHLVMFLLHSKSLSHSNHYLLKSPTTGTGTQETGQLCVLYEEILSRLLQPQSSRNGRIPSLPLSSSLDTAVIHHIITNGLDLPTTQTARMHINGECYYRMSFASRTNVGAMGKLYIRSRMMYDLVLGWESRKLMQDLQFEVPPTEGYQKSDKWHITRETFSPLGLSLLRATGDALIMASLLRAIEGLEWFYILNHFPGNQNAWKTESDLYRLFEQAVVAFEELSEEIERSSHCCNFKISKGTVDTEFVECSNPTGLLIDQPTLLGNIYCGQQYMGRESVEDFFVFSIVLIATAVLLEQRSPGQEEEGKHPMTGILDLESENDAYTWAALNWK